MDKIKEIADKADMIVNGYAFTRENDQIRILNLNNLDKALVISADGKVLETTMDDIEIRIVLDYWNSDREFIRIKYVDIICTLPLFAQLSVCMFMQVIEN